MLAREGDPPELSLQNLHGLVRSASHAVKLVKRDRVFARGILENDVEDRDPPF